MKIKDKYNKDIKEKDIILIDYQNIKYKAIVILKNGKLYPDRINKSLNIDETFPIYNEAIEIIGVMHE